MSNKTNHRRKGTKRAESTKQWELGILKGSRNTVRTVRGPKLWKQIRKRKERKENNEVIQDELNYIKDLIDGRKSQS